MKPLLPFGLCLLLAFPQAGLANALDDLRSELAFSLQEVRNDPNAAERLVEQLAKRGLEIVRPALELRADRSAEVFTADGRHLFFSLAEQELLVLDSFFAQLSWEDLKGELEALSIQWQGDAKRFDEVLDVGLGVVPNEPVRLLAQWAGLGDPNIRLSALRQAAFTKHLRRLTQENPGNFREFPGVLRDVHLSLAPTLIELSAEEPGAIGLERTSALLGRRTEADSLILSTLTKQAEAERFLSDVDRARQRVLEELDTEDPGHLAHAIRACEALECSDAAGRLIQLLTHEDHNVKQLAQQALEELSLERSLRGFEEWESWHQAQLNWWARESSELLDNIQSGSPAFAVRAAKEISQRRLFRERFLEALKSGSRRSEPEVAVVCVATLGHLGTNLSTEPLKVALNHEALEVQQAAYQALRRLTGENHGGEAADWTLAGW